MKPKLLLPFVLLVSLVAGCGRGNANPPEGVGSKEVADTVLQAFEDSPLNPVPDLAEEPEPEADCSGVLEVRDIYNGRFVRKYGRFAVGSMAGRAFIPLLYFNTLEDALRCANGLDVKEWSTKDNWVTKQKSGHQSDGSKPATSNRDVKTPLL